MSNQNPIRRGLGLLILSFLLCHPAVGLPQGKLVRGPGAQRVFDAFAQLRAAAARPPSSAPKSVIVSDADLNEYITYRILSEKEEVLRDLRLKFFPDNKVEGMMFLDLTRIGAPAFLRPNLHFYFSGRIMTQGSQIKFDVQSLFLEFKPVPVFLLNLAFYIASKTQKHGPAGLGDWYKLPPGVRDVVTEAGRLIFHFEPGRGSSS